MKKLLITFFACFALISSAYSQTNAPSIKALYDMYIEAMKNKNVEGMINYMYTADFTEEDMAATKEKMNEVFNSEKMTYSFIHSEIINISKIIEQDKIKYAYLQFSHQYSLIGKKGDALLKEMYKTITGGVANDNAEFDEANNKLTINETSTTYLISKNGNDWKLVDNVTMLLVFPEGVFTKLLE